MKTLLVVVTTILAPSMVTAPNNGFAVSVDTFPFIAGLIDESKIEERKEYQPFCTGTIVTAFYVLTTYGCIMSPGRYNRRDQVPASELIMIMGTGYSWFPQENVKKEVLYKKYTTRRGDQYIFPNEEDFDKVLETEDAHNAKNPAHLNAEMGEWDRNGGDVWKYFVDFTVIKVDKRIDWDDHTLPAIYPVQGRELSVQWWQNIVQEETDGISFMDSCYLIGWGTGSKADFPQNDPGLFQVRLKAVEVKYVPHHQCELSYCALCSNCKNTTRINPVRETCYKSTLYGDACLEDEGGPVWCPWAGVSTTKRSRGGLTNFKTGAVLGLLSRIPTATCSDAPGIYANAWQGYPTISRAVGYSFPPNLIVFEDVLKDQVSHRAFSHEDYPNVPSV